MAEPVPRPTATPHRVTVVHAVACHFCDEALDVLTELARVYPLDVELVSADGPQGAALVRTHRVGMFPLVLIDGAFFSVGRLPQRKLGARLARTAASTSAPTWTVDAPEAGVR